MYNKVDKEWNTNNNVIKNNGFRYINFFLLFKAPLLDWKTTLSLVKELVQNLFQII